MFQKDLIGPLKQGVKCTTIRVWKTSKYKQLQAAVMKGGLVEAKANYGLMSVVGYLLIVDAPFALSTPSPSRFLPFSLQESHQSQFLSFFFFLHHHHLVFSSNLYSADGCSCIWWMVDDGWWMMDLMMWCALAGGYAEEHDGHQTRVVTSIWTYHRDVVQTSSVLEL